MNRADAEALVLPFVRRVEQFQAVTHDDARALLGDERFERLLNDPMRHHGPIAETVYPWNVIDYLHMPNLRMDAMKNLTNGRIIDASLELEVELNRVMAAYVRAVPYGRIAAKTVEVVPGCVNVDYDSDGNVVGIEILEPFKLCSPPAERET